MDRLNRGEGSENVGFARVVTFAPKNGGCSTNLVRKIIPIGGTGPDVKRIPIGGTGADVTVCVKYYFKKIPVGEYGAYMGLTDFCDLHQNVFKKSSFFPKMEVYHL